MFKYTAPRYPLTFRTICSLLQIKSQMIQLFVFWFGRLPRVCGVYFYWQTLNIQFFGTDTCLKLIWLIRFWTFLLTFLKLYTEESTFCLNCILIILLERSFVAYFKQRLYNKKCGDSISQPNLWNVYHSTADIRLSISPFLGRRINRVTRRVKLQKWKPLTWRLFIYTLFLWSKYYISEVIQAKWIIL